MTGRTRCGALAFVWIVLAASTPGTAELGTVEGFDLDVLEPRRVRSCRDHVQSGRDLAIPVQQFEPLRHGVQSS